MNEIRSPNFVREEFVRTNDEFGFERISFNCSPFKFVRTNNEFAMNEFRSIVNRSIRSNEIMNSGVRLQNPLEFGIRYSFERFERIERMNEFHLIRSAIFNSLIRSSN